MTPQSLQHLESTGLRFIVFGLEYQELIAAFSEKDDAELFRSACLPKDSPWVVGEIWAGKIKEG